MVDDRAPKRRRRTKKDRRAEARSHAWRQLTLRDRTLGPLLSLWRQPPGIAMFHIGRSGSSVVARLLLDHPQIFWDGEAIRHRRMPYGLDRAGVGRHVRQRKRYAGQQHYGFETKPYHMRRANMRLDDYFDLLDECGMKHFIVLERRNILRKIVSNLVGRAKGSFSSPKHRMRVTRVRVDPEQVRMDGSTRSLREWIDHYQSNFRELATLVAPRQSLWLTYEDHVQDDPEKAYLQICDFLGLAPQRVAAVSLGRTNPFALSEVIENYDEIVDDLAGTPFRWMVTD